MICPHCGGDIAPRNTRCPDCAKPLSGPAILGAAEGETLVGAPGGSGDADRTLLSPADRDFLDQPPAQMLGRAAPLAAEARTLVGGRNGAAPDTPGATKPAADEDIPEDKGPLSQGQDFGSRYHIIKALGIGGMGAVYQAWDKELGVVVALKVIRPEAAEDPEMALELERRFKRELLLAREVTHRNVVRIHDLGEIDGMKYITMTYIEGEDLDAVLKRDGKVPVAQALRIVRAVVSGLVAAHEAGVVHRDLKPANIMVDAASEEAFIMDFGIARSATGGGGKALPGGGLDLADLQRPGLGKTVAGAIVGTVEYMAPEQFEGKVADQRADLYGLGLILYDMIIGPRRARRAESAIADLRRRMQEAPPPARSVDPEISEELDRVISRCLAPDAKDRYQTTSELQADLDRLDEKGEPLPRFTRRAKALMALAGTAIVGALVGTFFLGRTPPSPIERAPLPVLIANFDNRTQDPVFDGTLEQALGVGIETAPFITAYPRRDAQRLVTQLGAGSSLDESAARLIAVRQGIEAVLSGSIEPNGAGYTVTVKAVEPDGTVISTVTAKAKSKDEVLAVVGSLASRTRRALGDTEPPKPGEVETFTTVSLEAAHAYALGQESQADPAEAIRHYLQAVELDPNLGRAYAGLGAAHMNLKNQAEAEENYQKALSLVDRMSEREKFRTLGTYYLTFASNYEQAIETLSQLVALYPADASGWNNLATAYSRVGDMANTVEASRHATELSPGNAVRRYNYAVNLMLAGDFTTAATEAERVLESDPDFVHAYLPLALSTLSGGDVAKAEEIYGRLEQTSSEGASLGSMGQADLRMYGGRYRDAVETLLAGIAADEREGSSERVQKLVALAEAHLILGHTAEAAAAATAVLATETDDGVRFLVARVLVEAGQEQQAEQLATELEARLQKQTKSLALMIRGDLAMRGNRLAEAVDAYREAQDLHDSWFSHFLLGKAYVEAAHFAEALEQLEESDRRAGEVTDVFDSNTTTLRYLPPLYYWLGRAREGLGASDGARESYQQYLSIRAQADPTDPFLADVTQRTAE